MVFYWPNTVPCGLLQVLVLISAIDGKNGILRSVKMGVELGQAVAKLLCRPIPSARVVSSKTEFF